jgi:hypothetical protein
MKAVPIVLLGLLATVGAATRGGGAHTKHQAAGRPATSTLQGVVQHGRNTVLELREADSSLDKVNVSAGTSIGTQNAGRITAGDLRVGDRVVVQHNRDVQDVSQRTVSLSGVVAMAPISNHDLMTVQITPSRNVLVDVDARTRFTDSTHQRTVSTDIVDSDTVSVHGVLDSTLGEIVVAQAIERLGPKITRSYSSG